MSITQTERKRRRDKAVQAVARGESIQSVAAKWGVTYQTLYQACRLAGVECSLKRKKHK